MISLKMKKVVNNQFFTAVVELCGTPMKVSVAYGLTTLLDRVREERQKFEDLRYQLLKKYGELNEKGQPKTNEAGTEYILKDRASFNKEYDELLGIDVMLPGIKIDDIKDLSLSTLTVSELKPLITP